MQVGCHSLTAMCSVVINCTYSIPATKIKIAFHHLPERPNMRSSCKLSFSVSFCFVVSTTTENPQWYIQQPVA